jgi:hypothetical protein
MTLHTYIHSYIYTILQRKIGDIKYKIVDFC